MINGRISDDSDSSLSSSPTKKQRRRCQSQARPYSDGARPMKIFLGSDNAGSSEWKVPEVNALSKSFSRSLLKTVEATERSGWPLDRLPIEIFDEIISYLPRSCVQSMRLVNKEFEKKVSATFFQVVVVPFRPEIYGIAPDPSHGGSWLGREDELPQGAIMLQDKGMRVFHGYVTSLRNQ